MLSIINNKIVNLEFLRYAYCYDREVNSNGTTDYTIQLFLFSRCQSVEIKFDEKDERDKAFRFLESEINVYNKLKYPVQQVLIK